MKKNTRSRLLSSLLALALVCSLLPTAWAAEGVAITGLPSAISLNAGDTQALPLSLFGAAATGWDVAVSGSGVTASIPNGVLNITAASDAADNATATLTVTASCDSPAQPGPPLTVNGSCTVTVSNKKVTALTLSADTKNLNLTTQTSTSVTAVVAPSDAANPALSWSVSGDAITLGDGGVNTTRTVTAQRGGTATITVSTQDGSGISASIEIIVTDDRPTLVTGLGLNKTATSLTVGQKETLLPVFTPTDATNQGVTWSSSAANVASVDATGTVTANAPGTAVITATSNDGGKTASCAVTVSQAAIPVTGVTLDQATASVAVSASLQLTATVLPAEATNKTVRWTSSNPAVAGVDQSGKVSGVAPGTAVITATTADGGKAAACTVTVTPATVPVTGVTLNQATASVGVNATLQLTATVLPANATNKGVTWTSSNPAAATVDQSGKVTGKAIGTTVITVTTADGGKTAACTVTVIQGNVAAITYSVSLDKTLTLNPADFNKVCAGVYGNGLDSIRFDQNTSKGVLYFEYTESGGAKISTSNPYSYSNDASKPISKITFVPDGNRGDIATFTYTGWDSAGKTYSGTLQITLTTPSGDISYETGKNEAITFKDSDFNDLCRKITGASLDYVTFGSVTSSRGTLYLNYGGRDEEKLSTSTKCYYNGNPYLSSVTFVPDKNYTGAISISYTGWSNARDVFSGTVKITVRNSGTSISYSVAKDKTVTLDDSDFNSYCRDETGYNMDYVQITPPSSSKGIFYYRYGEGRDESTLSSATRYYRSSSPKLDDVTFVPKSGYTGVVSVEFTGRSTNGGSFSGTLKIRVGGADGETISYTATSGTAVAFQASDFNDYCKDLTDYNLDYVRFTPPSSSKGVLYYQRGQSGEKTASSSTSYYRSAAPKVDDLSFVPAANFTGTVEIPFTGRSTDGDSISGTVVITCSAPKEATLIHYTTDGSPVTFQSNDFISACATRGAGTLVSVRFNASIDNAGKLYYGYINPGQYGGQVSPLVSFTASGSASVSSVTFVPKAGYTGTTTITYTGTDSNGGTFTGQVNITVTPAASSAHFSDMSGYSWAAASVEFLYNGGITTGNSATTYGPALSITRGDFILMLYRAFHLTANVSGGFTDVPANSYYAQAIAVAKALGIAQGSDDGRFNPTAPLTREDAMVFLYRTLSRTGQTIAEAPTSYLSRFSDGASTSSYAQSSVAALVQAGVIQGDTSNRLNPKGSLTRAEMAVILHRVLTL